MKHLPLRFLIIEPPWLYNQDSTVRHYVKCPVLVARWKVVNNALVWHSVKLSLDLERKYACIQQTPLLQNR